MQSTNRRLVGYILTHIDGADGDYGVDESELLVTQEAVDHH